MESWHRLLAAVAGVAVVLAVATSSHGIVQHIKQYRQPEQQCRVVRILFMVPLYAVNSFISLCFLDAALYLDIIRDCYEAYVLYQFFLLCVSFLKGEANVRYILSRKPDKKMFWPCCCLPTLRLSAPSYYLTLKKGILQFVIVKPFFAIFAVMAEARGKYCNSQWRADCFYMYHALVLNTSQTVALTCLALFYSAVKEELRPWNPIWKFLCVKAVIFFSYWQGFCFAVMVGLGMVPSTGRYSSMEIACAIQDFLICMEMLMFAVAHLYVFCPEEYATGDSRRRSSRYALADIFSCFDVVTDTRETFDILPPAYTRLEGSADLPETVILRSMRDELQSTDLYQLGAMVRPINEAPAAIQTLDMAAGANGDGRGRRPRGQYDSLS